MFKQLWQKVCDWFDAWFFSWWYREDDSLMDEYDKEVEQRETQNTSFFAALIDFFRTLLELIVCRRAVEERLEKEAEKEIEEWAHVDQEQVGTNGVNLDMLIGEANDRKEPERIHQTEDQYRFHRESEGR